MRKQKVFKRVSAWLLAWTMVLCTLGEGITTWAEEPEEVEVQIEAQTDGEIEADTEEETEIDAEIEAETGNESADNQDGEDQNVKTPDEGEQVEKAVSKTGLVAYDEFKQDEEGKIIGKADGAEPKKELKMDLNGATLYLADRAENGTEESVPARNRLLVMGENGGTASASSYKLSQLDEAGYFKINFYETGTYRIYIMHWSTIYDPQGTYEIIGGLDDSANHITITVDYPLIGFYEYDWDGNDIYI